MRQQGVNGGVLACKFFFSQQGVDLPVAHAVQQGGVFAAFAFWHQVVGVTL